jgi:hypothetical protein
LHSDHVASAKEAVRRAAEKMREGGLSAFFLKVR